MPANYTSIYVFGLNICMKTLREMMDLIEAAQQPAEKNPYPKTWHDVDPKLGKQVDKMSPEEKVKKGYAHPDTLKKKGVAEAGPFGNPKKP
jgi:hypothetical protein